MRTGEWQTHDGGAHCDEFRLATQRDDLGDCALTLQAFTVWHASRLYLAVESAMGRYL
jgi:hypothetical protein